MTGFDYRPEEGFGTIWVLRVSGYDDEIDGELPDGFNQLSDVEYEIECMTDEYKAEMGASLTRVHGSHGWRVFEWDGGAVHRYEWEHVVLDLRCDLYKSPDNGKYMVTDELWASSGLDGWPCFRCLEPQQHALLSPSVEVSPSDPRRRRR